MKRSLLCILAALFLLASGSALAQDSLSAALDTTIYSGGYFLTVTPELKGAIPEDFDLPAASLRLEVLRSAGEGSEKTESRIKFNLLEDDPSPGISLWVKSDFSDRNIPKVYLVTQEEGDDSYQVMRLEAPMAQGQAFSAMLLGTGLLRGGPDIQSVWNRSVANVLDRTGTEIKKEGGILSFTLNGEGALAVLEDAALGLWQQLLPFVAAGTVGAPGAEPIGVIGGADGPASIAVSSPMAGGAAALAGLHEQIQTHFQKISGLPVFADNALTGTLLLDENGFPKDVDYAISLDCSVADFAKLLGQNGAYLKKPEERFALTLHINLTYTRVGEDVQIPFPALTEENSEQDSIGNADIDVNRVNIVRGDEVIPMRNQPFIDGGVVFVPLRETLNLRELSDDSILWNDGTIETLLPQYDVTLQIGSDHIQINGGSVPLPAPVRLIGATTYVPAEFLLHVGGYVSNRFVNEAGDSLIGAVVYLPAYPKLQTQELRFGVEEALMGTLLEKQLWISADSAGMQPELITIPADSFREKSMLVIAAGEPMVLVGRYGEEMTGSLLAQGAIYEPVALGDGISMLIPKAVKKTTALDAMTERLLSLLHESRSTGAQEESSGN